MTQTPSVDDIQHGGDHYKQGGSLQHWNMLLMVGFGYEYYIGAATKYTSRYGKKRGAEDVQKAIHFTDKLIDAVNKGQVPAKFRTTQGFRLGHDTPEALYNLMVNVEQLLNDYYEANAIDSKTAQRALRLLFEVKGLPDLLAARAVLVLLHNEVTGYVEPVPVAPTAAQRQATAMATGADELGAATPAYVAQGD